MPKAKNRTTEDAENADGHLIAAAPELLAALRQLICRLEATNAVFYGGVTPLKDFKELAEPLAVARAALAKAEGR